MLTDTAIRSAKGKEKAYRLFDDRGLYLEVMPNGSRYWRMKYRYLNKEKRLALGVYPEVSLADAREKRDQSRKQLAGGVDPSFVKQEQKRLVGLNAGNSLYIDSLFSVRKHMLFKDISTVTGRHL